MTIPIWCSCGLVVFLLGFFSGVYYTGYKLGNGDWKDE